MRLLFLFASTVSSDEGCYKGLGPAPFWCQHDDAAVFTAAALSLHDSSSPSFGTSTMLNDPEVVSVFNTSSASGSDNWSFAAPPRDAKQLPLWQVSMAAHAEREAGVGAVDTLAILGTWFPPSACGVYAFASRGGGAPAWSTTVDNCTFGAAPMQQDTPFVAVSDDGSTGAVSAYNVSTSPATPMLLVFDLQTGALRFTACANDTDGSGPVAVSRTGAWVAWSASTALLVLDGATGARRAPAVRIAGGNAQISDDGALLCTRGVLYAWAPAAAAYAPSLTFALPPDPAGNEWSIQSIALAPPFATFGYFSVNNDEHNARVAMFSTDTGALVADYVSPTNAKLQNDATVAASGAYAAAAFWGDSNDIPTVVVLSAGAAAPLLAFTSPGSMMGIAILHDVHLSNSTNDVVWVAAAGRDTPANVMAAGGDAFAWRLDVPL
jgi:hypothetical protein